MTMMRALLVLLLLLPLIVCKRNFACGEDEDDLLLYTYTRLIKLRRGLLSAAIHQGRGLLNVMRRVRGLRIRVGNG